MVRPEIDYSLYLVTGRELLPEGKDYYESLEESLQGGVTVVQVREKDADTGEFYEVALKTKEICDKYSVPIIINDRIDIFLALSQFSPSPPPAGIHIGQSDLPLPLARALLDGAGRSDAVIGISCQTVEEAACAKAQGADSIGVGPCWMTGSKKILRGVLGVRNVEAVLQAFGGPGVAIGGIKSANLKHVLHSSPSLSGVAIISQIVGAQKPAPICKALKATIDAFLKTDQSTGANAEARTADAVARGVGELLETLRKESPVINQLTNYVVMNDSANATLAVGASPIMATAPSEVTELASITGACLVNFGTIKDLEGMLAAGLACNQLGKPVVFDPVAAGATSLRRESAQELLATWQPTVIKGNSSEIGALLGSSEVSSDRGVDAQGAGFKDPAGAVRALARKERCVVVMTGEIDWISDGTTVLKISNGDALLGTITGSGCMTGTLTACFCAAARLRALASPSLNSSEGTLVQGDMLLAAAAGVLAMTIASEVAAARPDVHGPNTFRSALIDEMYNLSAEVIMQRANIEVI